MSDELDLISAAFDQERDMVAFFADEGPARGLLTELLHPDAEFEFIRSPGEADGIGITGVRRGLDDVLAAWSDWLEPYSSYRVEALESFEVEGAVMIVTHASGVTRTGAVALEEDQAVVWRFRDGKVWRWEAWLHASDARAAYGV